MGWQIFPVGWSWEMKIWMSNEQNLPHLLLFMGLIYRLPIAFELTHILPPLLSPKCFEGISSQALTGYDLWVVGVPNGVDILTVQ